LNDSVTLFAYQLPFHIKDMGYMINTFTRMKNKKKLLLRPREETS
jgi:hypothetical protein